jgi:hypothetical protein
MNVDLALHAAGLVLGTAILGFFFAKLEIQIEGGDGWATSLPTWRVEKHWLLDVFFGGRPLTGYHLWALSFMLLMFHYPVLLLGDWNWALEARTIGCFMVFWIVEDFLWFILNPAWGWARFKRSEVRWHKHWLLWFPTDYWTFAAVATGLIWWSFRG